MSTSREKLACSAMEVLASRLSLNSAALFKISHINRTMKNKVLRLAVKALSVNKVQMCLETGAQVEAVQYPDVCSFRLTPEQEDARLSIIRMLLAEGMSPAIPLQACIFSDKELFDAIFLPWLEEVNEMELKSVMQVVLTNIGFLQPHHPLDESVLKTVMQMINDSECCSEAHLRAACANAAFYGNAKVMKAFLALNKHLEKYLLPKVNNKLDEARTSERYDEMENYQAVQAVLIDHALRLSLDRMLAMIRNHSFELNGGGDKSIEEIGHPISKNAAVIYKAIRDALNDQSHLLPRYNKLAESIIQVISLPGGGSWFGWGSRKTSTTVLYTQMLNMISEDRRYLKMHDVEAVASVGLSEKH